MLKRFIPINGPDTGLSLLHTIPFDVIQYSRSSEIIREPFAEFLGVAILIIFGAGVDCQVVLSGSTAVASSQKGVSL